MLINGNEVNMALQPGAAEKKFALKILFWFA
jgi:hypothetical protein